MGASDTGLKYIYAWILCVISAAVGIPGPTSAAVRIYVSPTGDDANPGTKQKPLATLKQARDMVRQLKKTHPQEDIVVLLRGGIYRLTETLVFTVQDSGSPGQRIIYAAYPGETPIISAGVPVRQWKRLTPCPPHLPKVARGKVWVADVSFIRELKSRQKPSPTVASQMDPGWRFFSLYKANRRLPRARSRGFRLVSLPANQTDDRRTFGFPKGALRNWPDLAEAELALIPERIWISNILPIAEIDEAAGVGRTTVPATYRLRPPRGITNRPTVWVENVLAVLDEPGEWVLDSRSGLLYLWPPDGTPGSDILIPVLVELIRVEGNINYRGSRDIPVTNLTFRGLTFTHGDRFPWHGRTGWGLQHDWERFDSPTALVRLRGAENCVIEDCHFTTAGGTGIRLDLYCQNNRIIGNHFEHLGGVAILLAGYGPGTKYVNRRNEVANNLIHHIGELYWGSPAIFVWQSGENRIAHNHIHDVPYSGICVTGRIVWAPRGMGECSRTIRWWEVGGREIARKFMTRESTWQQRQKYLHARKNLVYRNDIHAVTQVTGDGNCIYVSGAGAGNVVLENYCHDCPGELMYGAIRCDDDQHETLIKRNIIWRCYRGRAEGIISKGRNNIIENIVADLRDVARHRGYLVFPWGRIDGSVIQRNVFYSRKKGQYICGQRPVPGGVPPARLRNTNTDYNLYFCTEDPEWATRYFSEVRPYGIEKHSISAAPMFVDVDNADFRFRPGSPALKLGIGQPISIDEVGLESPYRERWTSR